MSRKKPAAPPPAPKNAVPVWLIFTAVVVASLIAGVLLLPRSKSAKHSIQDEAPVSITGPVTYAREIAPIVFKNCAPCHRPGESGPFDLLTFDDVRKHAKDMARVTSKRIMPPWLPEHGYGDFEGERRLSAQEIALIQKWVSDGTPEGNVADLPPKPEFKSGWQLGEPNMVLEPNQAYQLPAEGKDIYYDFVIPFTNTTTRFVSGVEFLAGSRVVHHAFVMVDDTNNSRHKGAKNSPPGFYGMEVPETASMPGGQLLGFQPGKIPRLSTQGLSWVLKPGSDLVLQAHMNPSGKPELVRPKVGFYFTDAPPTNTAFRLRIASFLLDIPAGDANYVAENSYVTPVDLQLVRVGAHAHYLCKDMQGYAILPNGEKKWLLWIKDWDFKWHGDYEYKQPVAIPAGSKICLKFTYDNSTNNIRNPFNPPRRTFWGLNTTDEMGELYFQAMPRGADDYQKLGMDYSKYFANVSVEFYRARIKINPADEEMHQRLGRAMAAFGRMDEALAELTEAIRLNPSDDKAYFDLGSVYLRQGRGGEAYQAFQNVVRLNPEDSQAFGSLGIICLQAGRLDEGREYLQNAVRLNPEDQLAMQYLQRLNSRR